MTPVQTSARTSSRRAPAKTTAAAKPMPARTAPAASAKQQPMSAKPIKAQALPQPKPAGKQATVRARGLTDRRTAPEDIVFPEAGVEVPEVPEVEALVEVAGDPAAVGPALDHDAEPTLAEVEAVEIEEEGEAEGEGEEVASRDDDEPTSSLGRYFREMASLPVLRPQEEFERARRIEELEIATWEALLREPTVVPRMLQLCEQTLGAPVQEFGRLRRLVARRRSTTAAPSKDLRNATRGTAVELRRLDVDKNALEASMLELRALGRDRDRRRGAGVTADVVTRALRAADQAHGRAQRAKNDFVKANLRLVVSVARRYNHGYMPFADLIQEGNIGLMKAVDRFDHRRGYRFSTYATWWIRHAIGRALADKGRTVRLPVHLLGSQQRVARTRRELQTRLGRQPTDEELAAATGIAQKKLEALGTVATTRSLSLDRPMGDDEDDRKLMDLVQDPNADQRTVADTLADQAILHEVRAELARLKPVEADILRQRFGIDDDEERTLKEIGEKYRLSRERIRQLQEQALAKMRVAFKRRGLA